MIGLDQRLRRRARNGGVTLRLDTGAGRRLRGHRPGDLRPRPGAARPARRLPTAKYALEDEDGNFLSTERFQDASFGVEAEGVDFETMLEATAVRVVVFSADNTPEEFNAAIDTIGLHGRHLLGGLDGVAGHRRRRRHQGQRASSPARDQLASSLDHTVAMGDGRNDIEMLDLGRAAAWPWARPPRRSSPSPTRSPAPWTRTAPPPSCAACWTNTGPATVALALSGCADPEEADDQGHDRNVTSSCTMFSTVSPAGRPSKASWVTNRAAVKPAQRITAVSTVFQRKLPP